MTDKLGFAVVGAGWFGMKRIQALQRLRGASIQWVVDSAKEAGSSAARMANANYTGELDVALNDSKVDCVLVCIPNKMHPNVTIPALVRGKHVLCEKPLARNVKEATEMVQAARRNNTFLKTGSNHRYFPNVMRAMDLIKQQEIGEPIFFRGYIGHDGELLRGRWFWDMDLAGGGTFLDNGCHLLDISREMLGDFTECTGVTDTTYWPVAPLEDNGFALYKSKSGRTAMIQSSWIEWYGYMYFEIYGTEGFLVVDSRRANRTLFGRKGEDHTTVYDYSDLPPRSHELELNDFIEHVKKGEEPRPNGEDGLRVLQMVEALYRASKEGNTISF